MLLSSPLSKGSAVTGGASPSRRSLPPAAAPPDVRDPRRRLPLPFDPGCCFLGTTCSACHTPMSMPPARCTAISSSNSNSSKGLIVRPAILVQCHPPSLCESLHTGPQRCVSNGPAPLWPPTRSPHVHNSKISPVPTGQKLSKFFINSWPRGLKAKNQSSGPLNHLKELVSVDQDQDGRTRRVVFATGFCWFGGFAPLLSDESLHISKVMADDSFLFGGGGGKKR